ncbi:C40 family peptidase [Calidifontibacter terrae]
MGSYKPRHLKHETGLVSNLVSRRGLAVAATAATIVPIVAAEGASATAPPAAVAIKAARAAYVVSYGSTGTYVKTAQQRLVARGYRIATDGHFGPATRTAVRSFQSRNGLSADGVVGPMTWSKLGGVPSGSTTSRDETRPPATGGSASGIVAIAKQYQGVPYVYGGSTPAGFDCSGFTQYVYRKAGINIPRTASAQQRAASRVSTPRPGDLAFSGYPAHHVTIYVGNGYEIAARYPGTVIRVQKIYGYKTFGRF